MAIHREKNEVLKGHSQVVLQRSMGSRTQGGLPGEVGCAMNLHKTGGWSRERIFTKDPFGIPDCSEHIHQS